MDAQEAVPAIKTHMLALGGSWNDYAVKEIDRLSRQVIAFHWLMDELTGPSWEDRLAAAIEERSLRGRLRRARRRLRYLRAEARSRLITAVDVLRGKHDCYDY